MQERSAGGSTGEPGAAICLVTADILLQSYLNASSRRWVNTLQSANVGTK
ncbi:hypothetical protein J2Z49_000998 [Desulfofundulus luciae]|uniref:Uncharacterized protein n=1 Tax=Desulfofundulus luciae TaxID=74702 RepID=A0ABU0B372_9FIRM|nr:hypothetical protein [Desulfofundulus luciae]MDQ0285893.1 hypothetical protein [Desulfofundulus luciae]